MTSISLKNHKELEFICTGGLCKCSLHVLTTFFLFMVNLNEVWLFIGLIHPIQWTIALPVPPNARKRYPVYNTGRTGHRVCVRQVAHHTSFLSRQRDIIASFSFGAWSVQTCFLQKDVSLKISPFYELLSLFTSTSSIIIMSSPGQKRGT